MRFCSGVCGSFCVFDLSLFWYFFLNFCYLFPLRCCNSLLYFWFLLSSSSLFSLTPVEYSSINWLLILFCIFATTLYDSTNKSSTNKIFIKKLNLLTNAIVRLPRELQEKDNSQQTRICHKLLQEIDLRKNLIVKSRND